MLRFGAIDVLLDALAAVARVGQNGSEHGLGSLGSPRSTAPHREILFPDWKELEDKPVMWPIRLTYDPLVVRRPQTWLLREGWKKAGAISCHDVPGKHR